MSEGPVEVHDAIPIGIDIGIDHTAAVLHGKRIVIGPTSASDEGEMAAVTIDTGDDNK